MTVAAKKMLEDMTERSERCGSTGIQFDDYSKYVATAFDPEAKARRRKDIFPNDCKKAFEMGVRLTQQFGEGVGFN